MMYSEFDQALDQESAEAILEWSAYHRMSHLAAVRQARAELQAEMAVDLEGIEREETWEW
jgi:hypothetical protein